MDDKMGMVYVSSGPRTAGGTDVPTVYVQFKDYDWVRVFLYRGRRYVNICAPEDGLILMIVRTD